MMTTIDKSAFIPPILVNLCFNPKRSRLHGLHVASPLLLAFALLTLTVDTALAACPTNVSSSPPRWSFTTIDWVYSGGLSSSEVGAGATAWNSRQSFTTVEAGATYLDLNIVDNNSIGANLGEVTIWNQGNYPRE